MAYRSTACRAPGMHSERRMVELETLVSALRTACGVSHKRDIAAVVRELGVSGDSPVAVGDDCAAIPEPDGDGHVLLAIEGFIPEFVELDPWFAGWCGVMVNVSDIYAMGGRPTAIVNALWSQGGEKFRQLLQGMRAAARCYQVPVVGGHSNLRSDGEQLAVAILGRAGSLLSSFDAKPGDSLLVAVDLRGEYREPFPHWNCTTNADPSRLRGDLEILPRLAEGGLCCAAKDISQAGVLGTLLMLLECSAVGATVDLQCIPGPSDPDRLRWLISAFPSFGFVLAVDPAHRDEVIRRFSERDLACAEVGQCNASKQLHLQQSGQQLLAWDFAQDSLTGCASINTKEARCA